MSTYLHKINRYLKSRDPDLYAMKMENGVINIMRQGKRIDDSTIPEELENVEMLRPNPQYIFSLTDNLKINGTPVEWGIEPIHAMLRDTWGQDIAYEDMVRRREWIERDKERQRLNEFKAVAGEVRKPFAKITNDYIVRSKINGNRK